MAGEKILIVEDSMLVSLHIKSLLSMAGYDILAAVTSGEEAISTADRESPDLIIMDIMLAGEMNGITAAGIIQKKEKVPVIFLTAYSDRNTLDDAKATGPVSYITKPFEEKDLLTRIEIILYKHKIDKEIEREKVAQLIKGQEQERERISRELHDGLGQLLNAIKLNLDIADENNYISILEKVNKLTNEAISESRRIMDNLLPARILDFDLSTCLEILCKEINNEKTEIIFQTKDFRRIISDEIKLGLFRIAQEALNNVTKHSGCSKVYVQLYDHENFVHLSIEDNGKGFNKNESEKSGRGINNMLYRAEALNGKIQIESNISHGTLVSTIIPIKTL